MVRPPDIIKAELRGGPRLAKDLVDACRRERIKKSTVFYWLAKLSEAGEIRKVGNRYALAKLEKADRKEVEFYLAKIRDPNPDVRREAREDLRRICRDRKVTHLNSIWMFLREAVKSPKFEEDMEIAIRSLRFIAINSHAFMDEKAMNILRRFKDPLVRIVRDRTLDVSVRDDAADVLDLILEDDEHYNTLLELEKGVIEETARRLEEKLSGTQPFMMLGRHIWGRLLEKHLRKRRAELREWVYGLLRSQNIHVRGLASALLDEIRIREGSS
jgi:hypothetical protein